MRKVGFSHSFYSNNLPEQITRVVEFNARFGLCQNRIKGSLRGLPSLHLAIPNASLQHVKNQDPLSMSILRSQVQPLDGQMQFMWRLEHPY